MIALAASDQLFIDGTFQSAPKLLRILEQYKNCSTYTTCPIYKQQSRTNAHFEQQILILSGSQKPVLRLIAPVINKDLITYQSIVNNMRDIWYNELNMVQENFRFRGGFLMMDIEINLKKSFGDLSPNIKFCRFHVFQAWERNLKKIFGEYHWTMEYNKLGIWKYLNCKYQCKILIYIYLFRFIIHPTYLWIIFT